MIAVWRAGAEVVEAKRVDRSSESLVKRKSTAWFYTFHNRLSKTKISENVKNFRLMDRVVVDALKCLPERRRFMKGLFACVWFKAVTINYARAPRADGVMKFSFFSLWIFALEGVTSFSTASLEL